MKKILIVPSDKRQEYILKYFQDRGYLCEKLSNESKMSSADAVVLPIPSENDCKIKSTDISSADFAKMLTEKCVVFGFCMENTVLERELKKRNITFFDVYKSDRLATQNAYATAQGVLGHILNDTGKLLNEMKILLSGYGKTGRAICKILCLNKVDVTVLARREEYRNELKKRNIKSFSYDEELGEQYDYIINTVAAKVLDRHIMKTLGKDGKILEIASSPYGFDFDEANKIGLTYEILPSLPSKAAPESAGRFTAQAIETLIEKNIEEGEIWKC